MTEPMTPELVPLTVLQQRNVPEAIRSLSTLDSSDHVDLFTATTSEAAGRSPEQWARAVRRALVATAADERANAARASS